MISWIMGNIGTIIITLLLILLVTVIIRSMINDKKRGISSCGGNCAHCKACSACRSERKETGCMDSTYR